MTKLFDLQSVHSHLLKKVGKTPASRTVDHATKE